MLDYVFDIVSTVRLDLLGTKAAILEVTRESKYERSSTKHACDTDGYSNGRGPLHSAQCCTDTHYEYPDCCDSSPYAACHDSANAAAHNAADCMRSRDHHCVDSDCH